MRLTQSVGRTSLGLDLNYGRFIVAGFEIFKTRPKPIHALNEWKTRTGGPSLSPDLHQVLY
jgi:hypothetical protein